MDLIRAGAEDGERHDEGPSIGPYLRIQEQPVDEYRFRYKIEGRTNGSIPGVNSTLHCKTYPSVRVFGYKGPAVIRVSCVTKDPPYASHPHNLVGPSHLCKRGVATIHTVITDDNYIIEFRNLGIQCVKRCDVAQSMEERMSMRVDPFSVGFNPRIYPTFGLHSVRLAFQLLLPDARGLCVNPRRAVVSNPIADCKSKLRITYACKCTSSVLGGEPIALLTEKLPRDDVTVVFEEEDTGWTAVGEVVFWHKGYGLIVIAPPYHDTEIEKEVKVVFYLKRLPNGKDTIADSRSNSYPFEYTAVPKVRAKSPKLPSPLRSSPALKRPRVEDTTRSSQHSTENIASEKVPKFAFQEIPPLDDTAVFEAFYQNLNNQSPPLLDQRDYLTEAIQWNDNLRIPNLPRFLETDNQLQGQQYPEPHAEVYHQGLVADNHNVTADLQQYPTTSRQAQSSQVPTAIIKTKQPNQPHMTRSTMDVNVAPATYNVPIAQSYSQLPVGPLDYVGEITYNNPFYHPTANTLDSNAGQAACFRNNGPSTCHASSVNHGSLMNYESPMSSMNQVTSPSKVASLNYGPPMNYGSQISHTSPICQESCTNYGSSMNHAPQMDHGSTIYCGSPISQASPISQESSTNYGSPQNYEASMNHSPPMDQGSMNYGSPISHASPISQQSFTNNGSPQNYESSMNDGSPITYGSLSHASPTSQVSSTNHEYPVNQPTLKNHEFFTNHVPLMNRTTFASSMNQRQMRREAAVLNELLNNAQSVELPNSNELLESLVSLETYEDIILVQDLSDGIDQLSTEDP